MTGILDRFIKQPVRVGRQAFRPSSVSDCIALHIANELGDEVAVGHYVELLAQYGFGHLLSVFQQAMASGEANRARVFHDKLRDPPRRGEHGDSIHYQSRLIAIRVERRSIAVVIMKGDIIQYEKVRQLSSDPEKAVSSALAFVSWTLDQFDCPTAVLEPVPKRTETQRARLATEIIRLLRERDVTVWEVTKKQVFRALGYPHLRSRAELRKVVSALFPFLNGRYGAAFLRDAAALGLFVHIERLFIP